MRRYTDACSRKTLAAFWMNIGGGEIKVAIKTLEELRAIREQNSAKIGPRQADDEPRILVGMGTCGISAGARETMNAFVERLAEAGTGSGKVVPVGCIGYCGLEPLVAVIMPGKEPIAYGKIDKNKAVQIVEEHILGGKIIEKFTIGIDVKW